ncbi:MAG TPA: D-alanyl-D-alanine carboxypeptidase family protein [Abditibacterium sp.]
MPSRFLLTLSLLFPISARAQTPLPVAAPARLTAAASFVLDVDSMRVLSAKNPDVRMFPASTTKIMTCLVALERGNLNQVIRASKNAASTGESGIYLLEGENHTLRELVQAAMIHSANDACVAIAEGVGGSQARFIGWMNQKARELGCRNTRFVNPHGLHDPGHYTTAHDLAVISRAALKIPFMNEVAREKTATIGGNWKIGPTRLLINKNKLLFRWNATDGLKTGYTRQAGTCLVASATQINPATGKPWRLLAVVLKSTPGQSFSDCQTLLQSAFNHYQPQIVARRGQIVRESNVKGGAFALEATPARDVALPLRAFERQTLSPRVALFSLTAPIKKGQIVGQIEYFTRQNGKSQRIAATSLVARDVVPQTLLARAIPPVGNRVSHFSLAARILFLGLFCLGAASLLLFKRFHHVRRRSHSAFEAAKLPSRNSSRGGKRI